MDLCYSASKGINFSCKGCSRCCSADQEGYIFVFWEDIIKLQKGLEIPLEKLAKKYLSITSFEFSIWDNDLEDTGKKITLDTLVLNYEQKSDCLFLKKGKKQGVCMIYDYRPIQCRLYPFWNMVMESEVEFHMHKKNCIGISKEGKYYSKKQIKDLIYSERKIEYEFVVAMQKVNNNLFEMYQFLQNN